MRETLRMDLEDALVLEQLGEANLFETVEAAVIACLDRMQAAGVASGVPGEVPTTPPAAGGPPDQASEPQAPSRGPTTD